MLTEKTLEESLAKLLENEELSDVKFKVSGKLISAHKNILTARSDYFRLMLCENLAEDRLKRPILIENISYHAFKALLFYIYTGCVEENSSPKTVCELARVSDWYNIVELKDRCFLFAKTNLSIENVIPYFLNAIGSEQQDGGEEQPGLDVIEDYCLRFIAKNFSQLIERAEFKELPQKYLIHITQFYAQFQQ